MRPRLTCTALLVVLIASAVNGQTHPATTKPDDFARWEKAIAAYEAKDRENPPKPGGMVFIGSSTILRWKTLAEDFPNHNVFNRGFGGSEVINSVHFADRIVIPYKPKMVFLRAGGNDIHAGKSAGQVFSDFKEFVAKLRGALPQTEVVFIGLSPAP